jgi:hypothetical protein
VQIGALWMPALSPAQDEQEPNLKTRVVHNTLVWETLEMISESSTHQLLYNVLNLLYNIDIINGYLCFHLFSCTHFSFNARGMESRTFLSHHLVSIAG